LIVNRRRELANLRLMSLAAKSPPSSSEDRPAPPPRPTARAWRAHVLVAVIALAMAFYVTSGLWTDPQGHTIAGNVGDQSFFEWTLAYGVYLLQHGGNPFFTTLMNAPLGVNLAANTSITVYAILLAPLTKLAGPQISFITVLTLNLACSAYAWFLFLGRWVVRHRLAAAVAGLFCGFAPGFVSHANGHLNWTAGWIAPLVLWRLFKLRADGRLGWLRNGAALGVALAVGFSIAAEGLFFVALAGGVFVVAWALQKATRAEVRAVLPRVLAGLGVTAVVTGGLLAYPLYMHFAGPQTFGKTGFSQRDYSEDFASYLAYADRSLGALAGLRNSLAANPTEETSFFGLPLIVLVITGLILLWKRADPGRRATLRALMIVGGVFIVISWGPRLQFFGSSTQIALPYAILARLPLFDAALPARFSLVLVGVIGVVLALLAEALLDAEAGLRASAGLAAGFAIALVPIFPLPVLVTDRAPEPRFIADGTWKQYVPGNGVMSALPFGLNVSADAQRWQAYTMARGGKQFRIPDGYFLGPEAVPDENGEIKGRISAPPRHTDWLFLRAAFYGYQANITNRDRQWARDDFAYWNIDAVFLPATVTGPAGMLDHAALEATTTELLGPPEHVEDVLVWRIRPGLDPIDR
jgi:hypothetical protein